MGHYIGLQSSFVWAYYCTGLTAKIMLEELFIRFQKIFDSSDPGHKSIYLVATMLDPRFKELLTSGQTEHAKKEFLRYVKNDESDDSDTPVTPPAGRTTDDEPPEKHMKYSCIPNVLKMMEIVATERKEQVKRCPKVAETQLNSYLESSGIKDSKAEDYFNNDFDLLSHWSKSSYQVIAPFAIDILSAPCSSAPVERTFSAAGISTSGRRNRLASSRLENEVLLKKNREYYDNEN